MANSPVANAKVSMLLNLDVMGQPYRGFIQGGIWEGGYWWVCNSQKNVDGGGYESNYINKYTSKGKYLGRMTLLGSGHGSIFCMIGDEVWVGWDKEAKKDTSGRDLRHVTWKKDARVKESDATYVDADVENFVAPCPLGNNRNQMTLYRSAGEVGYFYLCNRSNLRDHLRTIRVDKLHPPGKTHGTFQGAITYGDSLYALWAATDDNPQQLAQYKWPSTRGQVNQKPYSILNITKAGLDKNFNSKEPEGLSVYGGKLVFGQRFGPITRRAFRQYYVSDKVIAPPVTPPVTPPKPPWPPVTPPKPPPVNRCGVSGSPSGVPMPTAAPVGWTRVFSDDFIIDQPLGTWPGVYADEWYGYDCDEWGIPGGCDTAGIGRYSRKEVVSVSGGMMHYSFHTPADGIPRVAAEGPKINGTDNVQLYGRYSIRWRVDKMSHYGAAFLLWPAASPGHPGGNWDEGEINFPEGSFDGPMEAFNHCVGNPSVNCATFDAGVTMYSGWHTTTIEWKPGSIEFFLDGKSIGKTLSSIPKTPFRWVLQTGVPLDGIKPAATTKGNLDIDWVTIDRPSIGVTGASGAGTANGTFGTWRGNPLTAVGTWVDDPAIYPFGPPIDGCTDCGMYQNYDGVADIGLAPGAGLWQGWDAEAAGANDAFWHDVGNNLAFFWSQRQRGTWYLRPYYEANGDWFEYAIKNKVVAFKTAFARTAAILREEFPQGKIMFGTACSSGDPALRPWVADIWPADSSFDALSVDFYNNYPWVNTVPDFTTKINTGAEANSLEPQRLLAKQHGKPVVVSEWASAAVNNGGGGGDAPEFISGMRNWLSLNQGSGPGQVLMDVYFNVPTGYPEQYWLWNGSPNPAQPLAAARYAALS